MIEIVVEAKRAELETVGAAINQLRKDALDKAFDVKEGEDRGEVIANLTLAYRHIEDARMRLGKVYQARDGGISNNVR